MNLDTLGSIGEAVGALAVLVSVVYLAIQLKQHTTQLKDAAMKASIDEFNAYRLVLFENEDAARIWAKGTKSTQDFDEVEFLRFRSAVGHVLSSIWGLYLRVQSGTIEAEMSYVDSLVDGLGTMEGVAEMWVNLKPTFPPDFAEYIDQRFRTASKNTG